VLGKGRCCACCGLKVRFTRSRRWAKGGSHFKVCWAGKLVIGDRVTGFLIIAAVGAGLQLDPDIIGDAKPTAARSAADLSAPKRGICRRPAIRSAVNICDGTKRKQLLIPGIHLR
jgi:hypothetical protein